MKVIIDIPNIIINGVAGMFAMQLPNDSGEIMAAMEKCQQIDELEVDLDGDDVNNVKMAIASVVLVQEIKNLKQQFKEL